MFGQYLSDCRILFNEALSVKLCLFLEKPSASLDWLFTCLCLGRWKRGGTVKELRLSVKC